MHVRVDEFDASQSTARPLGQIYTTISRNVARNANEQASFSINDPLSLIARHASWLHGILLRALLHFSNWDVMFMANMSTNNWHGL